MCIHIHPLTHTVSGFLKPYYYVCSYCRCVCMFVLFNGFTGSDDHDGHLLLVWVSELKTVRHGSKKKADVWMGDEMRRSSEDTNGPNHFLTLVVGQLGFHPLSLTIIINNEPTNGSDGDGFATVSKFNLWFCWLVGLYIRIFILFFV